MPTLYVASNYTIGGYGHLQFVYDAGNGAPLKEAEVQSPNIGTLGNWDYYYDRLHLTHDNTKTYDVPDQYFITEVTLKEEQSADYVWTLIGQIMSSMMVTGADIDYILLSQNSNSFINTLSYVIGLTTDWSTAMLGGDITELNAYSRNVLLEAETGWDFTTGIALNLSGTAGNDYIYTGNGNDTLGGAEGNDTIKAGYGNDTISGGAGNDSIYGGNGDDSLTEGADASSEEDGGSFYGGSGNDQISVVTSTAKSSLYGGSGNDLLVGNGLSTLYGGSGSDKYFIVTGEAGAGGGDTIVGGEGKDELWIDGIKIVENVSNIMFGYEVGEPGDPALVPFQLGTEALLPGQIYTAPLAIVFRIVGMASDSTGTVTDVVYEMLVFKDVSMGPSGLIGTPEAQWRFDPADAVAIVSDFRQGDFGLFAEATYGYGLLHNSYNVLGRLVSDGIDYHYGYGLGHGDPREMSEDDLNKEKLEEAYQNKIDLGFHSTPSTNGSGDGNDDFISGDDNSGSLDSGAGNDFLISAGGSDTVYGGAGDDFISGGLGDDELTGNDGNDTIYGDWSPSDTVGAALVNGADVISGGLGADYLSGDGGADTLNGDAGNDTLLGGEDADSFFGGANDDFVDGGSENDVVMGDAGNDTVLGGDGVDLVYGGSGDDVVAGNGGHDSVFGDAGNDTVSGGEGNDIIYGGSGSDSLVGAAGDDTLSGGEGDDYLQGGFLFDTYNYASDDGNDTIFDSGSYLDEDNINFSDIASTAVQYGRVNDDLVIYINDGSKITIRNQYRVSSESVELAHFSDSVTADLVTVPVQTSVLGTAGDDYLFGVNSTTAELIDGFAGNDSVNAFGGNDSVYGGDGNDTLQGGSGADYVYGGNDDDLLDGGTGNDTLFGGVGNDTFIVDSTADVVNENAGEGTDSVLSTVTWTLSETVENLTLTGTASVDGTGNAIDNLIVGNSPSTGIFGSGGANRLSGLGGNDTLIGGGGADTLDGGTGADSMVGGDGADTFIVDDVLDLTIELSGEGVDLVSSSVSWTLDTYVENLTLTGSAALNGTGSIAGNVITGNTGENLLSGLAGNDTLIGGDGNDILDGGTGTDSLVGGLGDDLYIIDSSSDKAVEAASGGIDTVQSSATFTLGVEVENLTLTGSEAINGTGNTIANIVTGNSQGNSLAGLAGNDTLFGDSGDDTLDGGTGTDSLIGGEGNDTYIVDALNDVVIEGFGEGTDLIQSALALTLAANIENLTITGTASVAGAGNELANLITGNSGVNNLSGLDGNDTIVGAAGHDTLDGGIGDDSLAGGTGNDVYVVDTVSDLIVELAGEGTDLVQATVSWTLGTEVENLTLIGSAAINGTGNTLANVLTGNTGANLLSGLAGNDTLVALDGNDTLDGGIGVDSMTGGIGDDLYIVDDVFDKAIEATGGGTDLVQSSVSFTLGLNVENLTLTGTAVIDGAGNSLANAIVGNSAANILTGGGGNDTVSGGAGNDTYIVDDTGDVLTEIAAGGTDIVQSSVDWTLGAEFENLTLTGTTSIDGTGNALANIITGNTGANALSGAAGNDTLDGGNGADTLDGGLGTDSLIGGAGNDTFVVDVATDVIVEVAAGGADLVQAALTWTLANEFENLTLIGSAAINGTGNTVANVLTGNTGANLLSGQDGNDTLLALDGNDTVDGGLGTDSMTGGIGDDLYVVDVATDVVIELSAAGNDTVQSAATYTLASNVETLILTGAAAINGTGNTLDNVLTGNSAANLLSGGSGNDTITGGGGNDTLVADALGDVLIEAAAGGTDLVQASIDWTLGAELENLTLTGTAGIDGTGNTLANILTGNIGANSLSGADGNDTLTGDAGADTLDGGLGTDSLIGGAGNDIFIVDVATDVIVELAGEGTDLVQAALAWTLGTELENLTLTGSAAINGTGNTLANILTGNTGNNTLYGGAGNDTLDGGVGNDTLDGGVGNDSMIGGAGDDVFIVDATTDIASEASAGGTDTVQAAATFTLGLNIEQLVLTGTVAINGTGNSVANVITGNTAANLLSGSGGNDTLIGNDGNDTLDGGTGNDSMTGGSGDDAYIVDATLDAVIEAAAGGTDTVTSSITHTLAANVENLILSGTSGNGGTGNTLANALSGNTGANALSGLDGNDTLTGGGGNDALNGGIGADQFVFTSTTSGIDVIADFNELDGGGEEGDVLRFDGLNVGTFVYLGTSAFSGGSDNSEARVVGNQVLFDANGDGTADITITLTGLTAASQLAATDFLFV